MLIPIPRSVWIYGGPPVALAALFGAYRIWFAGEPEAPPPTPPPAEVSAPSDGGLSPFGDAPAGTKAPAATHGPKTAGGGGEPAPGGAASTIYDLDSASKSVQELAAKLFAAFPEVAQWVRSPGAIRRLVAAVDCIAQGTSPRQHLSFLEPTQPFRVTETSKGTVIAPASYSRYDRAVAIFCHGEAATVAATYQRLEPALDLAYRELGYGQGRFRDILATAAAEIEAVPVPTEPVYVVASGHSYAFADSALQSQSDARKHLLRMGPANVRKVQARVRELAAAIGLKPAAP